MSQPDPKERTSIEQILEAYTEDPKVDLYSLIHEGKEVQFVALENHKKPGSPIFIQDDGKIGFPSINGLQVKIGDTIKGIVHHTKRNYFFVEVTSIVTAASDK